MKGVAGTCIHCVISAERATCMRSNDVICSRLKKGLATLPTIMIAPRQWS